MKFIEASLILKFIKFVAVGFTGLAVDFFLTWLLKEKVKINKFVANGIGFMTASSTNYILNRIWTFESVNPDIKGEYIDFILVSIIGLGINSLVLWILIKKFKMNFYLAKFFAIIVTTIWNFIANLLITFS
jgi:putative flippase GtrA